MQRTELLHGRTKLKTTIGGGPCDRGAIGAKAAKMMRHAKAQESRLEREIEKREALMHDVEYDERLKLHPEPYFRQNLLLSKDLSIFTVTDALQTESVLRSTAGTESRLSGATAAANPVC